MKGIISRECYKICHSKKLWGLTMLMLVLAWLMFSYSIGWKKEMVYVWLDETEEEKEAILAVFGELKQNVVVFVGEGQIGHNAGEEKCLWMTSKTFKLFQEGGPLYEKYVSSDFADRMVLRQMIGGELALPEEEDFEAVWKFHKMLTDPSAAAYTAIIFPAFFFGMDFLARGYQGGLFAGEKRRRLFWGKYLTFFFFFLLLSGTELLLTIGLHIPRIGLLQDSYLIKGLVMRCLRDTGRALLCVPLVFLAKSEWKAFGLSFLMMTLFMSNLSVIYLDPYQFVSVGYWKACGDVGTTWLIGAVTAVLFVISGLLSAELFQRAELK